MKRVRHRRPQLLPRSTKASRSCGDKPTASRKRRHRPRRQPLNCSATTVGQPVCREAECKFSGVYKRDPAREGLDSRHLLAKSPMDYELEVTNAGHLARSLKFTVAADGGLDNGVATKEQARAAAAPSRPYRSSVTRVCGIRTPGRPTPSPATRSQDSRRCRRRRRRPPGRSTARRRGGPGSRPSPAVLAFRRVNGRSK